MLTEFQLVRFVLLDRSGWWETGQLVLVSLLFFVLFSIFNTPDFAFSFFQYK